MERQKMLAVVGLVVTIPALVICLWGLSGLNPPPILTHPVTIFVGLALALAINVPSVAHINARLEAGNLVGIITLRLKGSLVNFSVIALSLALLATIAVYVFIENFQPR